MLCAGGCNCRGVCALQPPARHHICGMLHLRPQAAPGERMETQQPASRQPATTKPLSALRAQLHGQFAGPGSPIQLAEFVATQERVGEVIPDDGKACTALPNPADLQGWTQPVNEF